MKIHCKYTGIRGSLTIAHLATTYLFMLTQEAEKRASILTFWEKHGYEATCDAYGVSIRTLYYWKDLLVQGKGKLLALNPRKKSPTTTRKRVWSQALLDHIRFLREEHPNLGKEKIYPLLRMFCADKGLQCPSISTIGRLITDLGGLRKKPQTMNTKGQVKVQKRTKVQRKPKEFKALYPGHMVAFDSIVTILFGVRYYILLLPLISIPHLPSPSLYHEHQVNRHDTSFGYFRSSFHFLYTLSLLTMGVSSRDTFRKNGGKHIGSITTPIHELQRGMLTVNDLIEPSKRNSSITIKPFSYNQMDVYS